VEGESGRQCWELGQSRPSEQQPCTMHPPAPMRTGTAPRRALCAPSKSSSRYLTRPAMGEHSYGFRAYREFAKASCLHVHQHKRHGRRYLVASARGDLEQTRLAVFLRSYRGQPPNLRAATRNCRRADLRSFFKHSPAQWDLAQLAADTRVIAIQSAAGAGEQYGKTYLGSRPTVRGDFIANRIGRHDRWDGRRLPPCLLFFFKLAGAGVQRAIGRPRNRSTNWFHRGQVRLPRQKGRKEAVVVCRLGARGPPVHLAQAALCLASKTSSKGFQD